MTNSPSSPPTSDDLGLLVRRHRREAGLTQEELAERAGISARAVSDIERGLRTRIYLDTAQRLGEALRLDEAGRAGLVAAGRRRPGHLQNVPDPPPTPLWGREAELQTIATQIARGVRLCTLSGPAGVGKTRLALEAGQGAAGFVPLAPLTSPDQVPGATLHALGLPDTGSAVAALARELTGPVLLVLDNFEHVLDAAGWVAELLTAIPGLQLLVTSRAPLRLRFEQEVVVPVLGREAALSLFRERATAVRSGTWNRDQDDAAERICARLDRLPLALELAASALRHETLTSLAAGLEHELDLLGEGGRDMPERHRSMQAAIGWSAERQGPGERELLWELSVFAGTFDARAAAAVAGLEQPVALRRIARLVEQSLLQLCPEIEGRPRYRLLEVVRQFALDHARKAGRERPLGDAHLEHFLRLSESAEPNLHGPDRSIWFARLIVDGDNLNRALEHAAAVGDAERGLRLATALWRWWRQRGDFNQGRAQLRRLLALPGASDSVRARALWGASWLALHQLDLASARSLSSELLELATRTADTLARRNALTGLGMAAAHEGRYAESLALFEEALELARVVGDPRILAFSVFNRAHALLENGRRADSVREFEDARCRYLKLGDTAFAARTQLSQVLLTMDSDPGRAASLLVDAVSTFRSLDEAWGQVESLEVGVALLAASSRIEAAALAAGAAEAAHQRLGTAQLPADRMLHSRYLEPATATRVWEESFGAGRDMELDDAVSGLLRAIEFAS